MIRVKTLRNIAKRNGSVFRVRRRGYEGAPGRPVVDMDGEVGKPDTWARCEEDWFTHLGYAEAACRREAASGREGYLDQCKAQRVLAILERSGVELETFEAGRYRVVGRFEVSGREVVSGL
jgi:hypothetical protein